jgi:hypothetical protein
VHSFSIHQHIAELPTHSAVAVFVVVFCCCCLLFIVAAADGLFCRLGMGHHFGLDKKFIAILNVQHFQLLKVEKLFGILSHSIFCNARKNFATCLIWEAQLRWPRRPGTILLNIKNAHQPKRMDD